MADEGDVSFVRRCRMCFALGNISGRNNQQEPLVCAKSELSLVGFRYLVY